MTTTPQDRVTQPLRGYIAELRQLERRHAMIALAVSLCVSAGTGAVIGLVVAALGR